MAGYLLAGQEQWRRLGPAAEHLDLAVTRLFGTVADQYLDEDALHALESPAPTDEDRRYVGAVDDDLRRGLGDAYDSPESDDRVLTLAFRCRTTLTRLDELLRWTEEQGAECPWEAPSGRDDRPATRNSRGQEQRT